LPAASYSCFIQAHLALKPIVSLTLIHIRLHEQQGYRPASFYDLLDFDRYLNFDNFDTFDYVFDIQTRNNCDHVIDAQGRRLIDLCKNTSLVIGNGQMHFDTQGDYTFHSLNGSSTVDYLLLDKQDFNLISYFEIAEPNEFSDHSGLQCMSTLMSKQISNTSSYDDTSNKQYIKWDPANVDDFLNRLVEQHLQNVISLIENEETNIDNVVKKFVDIIRKHSFDVFGKTKTLHNKTKPNCNKQKWFNHECFNARKQYKIDRNKFLRKKKTLENKHIFLSAKSNYNKIKNKAKNAY
jgi:hypothetical protein